MTEEKDDTLQPIVMNREAIQGAIPHRDPFLFLDTIVEATENTLSATWNVPRDAAWFKGHFPGRPVLPGVLISEHVFQAAAVLISRNLEGFGAEDGVPVLTKIEAARFRRMVAPGETLLTSVKVDERLGPAWYMSATVTCKGLSVVKLRCTLSASEALARVTEDA